MSVDRKRLGELLDRLKETHDEKILGEIIEMTQDYVFGGALRLAGDRNTADDLAQKAFLALTQRYDVIQEDVLSWLLGVVRNAWKEELRHRKKDRRNVEALAVLTGSPDRQRNKLEKLVNGENRGELARRLEAALSSLPRRERECVWLRYAENLAPPVIAEKLEISVTSVYRYCSAGLRKLRQKGVWENDSE